VSLIHQQHAGSIGPHLLAQCLQQCQPQFVQVEPGEGMIKFRQQGLKQRPGGQHGGGREVQHVTGGGQFLGDYAADQ
jgi:hypothetical protein